jgi:hypothetical protein
LPGTKGEDKHYGDEKGGGQIDGVVDIHGNLKLFQSLAHFDFYGDPGTPDERLAFYLGSERAISLFRGSNFGGLTPTIELLYGLPQLPVYMPHSDRENQDRILEGHWRGLHNLRQAAWVMVNCSLSRVLSR